MKLKIITVTQASISYQILNDKLEILKTISNAPKMRLSIVIEEAKGFAKDIEKRNKIDQELKDNIGEIIDLGEL